MNADVAEGGVAVAKDIAGVTGEEVVAVLKRPGVVGYDVNAVLSSAVTTSFESTDLLVGLTGKDEMRRDDLCSLDDV